MTRLKKNTSLLPLSLSLSLSLYFVNLSMHFDFPERMCMYLSLSLFLSIYICKNGLDPDQTRTEFRKECFVNLKMCACDRKPAKCSTKAKSRCARYNWFSVYFNKCIHCPVPCADPEGGKGVRTPLKNHKNIGILSNTGPDPLKFSKLPKVLRWRARF